MEFRDALKMLRSQTGITQADLGNILNVNYSTVCRWELGRTVPNRSAHAAIIKYAQEQDVSKTCMDELEHTIQRTRVGRLNQLKGPLYSVEHESLCSLVDNAYCPIYVCNYETYELLYMNHKAEELADTTLDSSQGKKCYECFAHRESPCSFCHRKELKEGAFRVFNAFRPETGTYHGVRGRIISWNGRKAQFYSIVDVADSIDISEQQERIAAYKENVRLRKESADNMTAAAHYNLTKDMVCDVICENDAWKNIVKQGSIDDILQRLGRNKFSAENQRAYDSIRNREAMIEMYFNGKNHICIKHYMSKSGTYYQAVFDIVQNPITYDVEAFAILQDITEETLTDAVLGRLINLDYESIILIDSVTGQATPFTGTHMDDIIAVQKRVGDNEAGVEAYLRENCADDDVDRIIKDTSLSKVREQLEIKDSYAVSYSLRQNDTIIMKRVMYTYLDEFKGIILCTMQDVTDINRQKVLQSDRVGMALKILQEESGMDVARYDLKTKTFISNCRVTGEIGYDEVIENVPEVFINDGCVASASISEFREFYRVLRSGEAATMNPILEVGDGSFHMFRASGRIVFDEDGIPYQAVIVFSDVDELRENSSAYRMVKRIIKENNIEDYVINRCNLTRGMFINRIGENSDVIVSDSAQLTINERTKEYAANDIHPDDAQKYIEVVNTERLLKAYEHGVREVSIDYRDSIGDGEYQWKRLTLEMAQYPDCTDIEGVLLFEVL